MDPTEVETKLRKDLEKKAKPSQGEWSLLQQLFGSKH